MIEHSLARGPATFTLTRVYSDGTTEIVETTTDHVACIEAGHKMMHLHPGAAFSLYRGERRVAKFGHHRIALRVRPAAIEAMVV